MPILFQPLGRVVFSLIQSPKQGQTHYKRGGAPKWRTYARFAGFLSRQCFLLSSNFFVSLFRLTVFVEHAIGSLQNPMSDAQLEAKFRGLSDAILGTGQTSDLIKACWAIGEAASVKTLLALSTPELK